MKPIEIHQLDIIDKHRMLLLVTVSGGVRIGLAPHSLEPYVDVRINERGLVENHRLIETIRQYEQQVGHIVNEMEKCLAS
jgi:hypothetical protein